MPLTDSSFSGAGIGWRPFKSIVYSATKWIFLTWHWMDPQFTERNPKSSSSWHRATQQPIPFSFQHCQVPLLQLTQIAHHLTIITHSHLLWDFTGKISWAYNSSFNTPTSLNPNNASRISSWATQQCLI